MTVPTAVAAVERRARRKALPRRLGQTIREHRVALNMGQADVARELDRSQPTVARWEAGLALPDFPTALKIAALLGISLDDLVEVAA